MKHNSKRTLTTKYSAGEQIVMDRNVSLRYNKKHHIMEEKVMGKRKSVLKTATAAAQPDDRGGTFQIHRDS